MWNEKELQFLDIILNNSLNFSTKEFKEALKNKNIEIETVEIEYFINPIDHFTFIGHHFYLADFGSQYISRIKEDKNQDLSIDFKRIVHETVFDKEIYHKIHLLLSEKLLEEHIQQVCSILKYGYYHVTLAEIVANNKANIEFDEQLIKLTEFAFNADEMHSIKFNSLKNGSIEINSIPLLNLITNYLADMYSKNLNAAGFFESIKTKARKESLDIQIRNQTLYKLILYFQHFTDFNFAINNGEISINKEQCIFLYSILEVGKVLSERHTNSNSANYFTSDEPNLIRRFLGSFLERKPFLKELLISLPKNNDIDSKLDNEIDEIIEEYTQKFKNKTGI